MRKLMALCLSAAASTAAFADTQDDWTRPQEPFRIVGPVSYVGTHGIGVYLIRSSAGLILLDAGPAGAVPIIERNIATLGYRLRDVKIIITSHAHWDHVEGVARLKHDTGARLLASPGDRGALETGTPPSDTDYGVHKFPPVKVDGMLVDRAPVRLGNVAMVPVFTPGHTPGCTTWTLRVMQGKRPLNVVFPCSISVAGNRLVGNEGYPGIVQDYRRSFVSLRALKADVTLPAHPEMADVLGRAKRRDDGDAQAFIDPKMLSAMVSKFEADFNREVAKQRTSS